MGQLLQTNANRPHSNHQEILDNNNSLATSENTTSISVIPQKRQAKNTALIRANKLMYQLYDTTATDEESDLHTESTKTPTLYKAKPDHASNTQVEMAPHMGTKLQPRQSDLANQIRANQPTTPTGPSTKHACTPPIDQQTNRKTTPLPTPAKTTTR